MLLEIFAPSTRLETSISVETKCATTINNIYTSFTVSSGCKVHIVIVRDFDVIINSLKQFCVIRHT